MQKDDVVKSLIDFCLFSFESCNPKVVFTSAIVLFNAVLCYKKDKEAINDKLKESLVKINKCIID